MFPSSRHGWKQRIMQGTFVVVCATSLISCATLFGQPEQGLSVQERTRICFRQAQNAHIMASVTPIDCYSYRCASLTRATGTAVVDTRAFRVDFEATFVIATRRPLLAGCLLDCMGGGQLDFDLGPLDPALYEVNLWGNKLGVLSVPSGVPWQDQCLPGIENSTQ